MIGRDGISDDPDAAELAHVLIKDPAAIPLLVELPKPVAVRLLQALATAIAAMDMRLVVLEARHHHDDDDPPLTLARARLGALLPRLAEREVEALLGIAELFLRGPDAQPATDVLAQQGSAAPSAMPSPVVAAAPPGTASLAPSGARPTYTVREAAQLLGMKETTLRERIRMRRVRVLRLGRRVLVKAEELERLLAEREAQPRR